MYKFYKDKSETFECNIGVEGTSLSKASARLVLESSEYNLIFKGNINSSGKCTIEIPKLKVLSENLTGTLKLEVIVDEDTYFVPYEDKFEVAINKKVTVEVLNKQETKPLSEGKKKVTATVVKQNNTNITEIVNEIYSLFNKYQVNLLNIKGNKKVPFIVESVVKKRKIDSKQLPEIQSQLLKKLVETI